MEVQLQGLVSRGFQFDKAEGGKGEVFSHARRVEASSGSAEARKMELLNNERKKKKKKREKEEMGLRKKKKKKGCLELGIDDICLNFQTFLLGFDSLGFATNPLSCLLSTQKNWCFFSQQASFSATIVYTTKQSKNRKRKQPQWTKTFVNVSKN